MWGALLADGSLLVYIWPLVIFGFLCHNSREWPLVTLVASCRLRGPWSPLWSLQLSVGHS